MNNILLVLLLMLTASLCAQDKSNSEFYRHLRYNHISPYANISGIHPIDQSVAKLTSHYVFNYDDAGRLIEIINNHYHTEKKHPLASIGVYRLTIEYKAGKEIRI